MKRVQIFSYSLLDAIKQRLNWLLSLVLIGGFLLRAEYVHNKAASTILLLVLIFGTVPLGIMISLRNSAILVDNEGIAARAFFVVWKRRKWVSITRVQRVQVVKGLGGRDVIETRFVIVSNTKELLYPVNFTNKIHKVGSLLDLLNSHAVERGIELTSQKILYRMKADPDGGTSIDRLTVE